jgi:hypothetical protein
VLDGIDTEERDKGRAGATVQTVEHWQVFGLVVHRWISFLYYILPLGGIVVNFEMLIMGKVCRRYCPP